jgi:mono/diheme cytochrome c family protein
MKLRPFAAMKIPALALTASLLFTAGCDHLGSSRIETVERPESITDFKTLYGQNCAGCHGANGQNGAAFDLSNPAYQQWVSDATLQQIISTGEPPTQMPAFAQSAGGTLTDAQVDALVNGMRAAWRPSGATAPAGMPGPDSHAPGDADRGKSLYATACQSCHSQPNQKVTDPTYLALINNRTLRLIIIAGRPDLGHPDWTGQIGTGSQASGPRPGYPLNDQAVADITAYIDSFRSDTPGQPYSQPQQ